MESSRIAWERAFYIDFWLYLGGYHLQKLFNIDPVSTFAVVLLSSPHTCHLMAVTERAHGAVRYRQLAGCISALINIFPILSRGTSLLLQRRGKLRAPARQVARAGLAICFITVAVSQSSAPPTWRGAVFEDALRETGVSAHTSHHVREKSPPSHNGTSCSCSMCSAAGRWAPKKMAFSIEMKISSGRLRLTSLELHEEKTARNKPACRRTISDSSAKLTILPVHDPLFFPIVFLLLLFFSLFLDQEE